MGHLSSRVNAVSAEHLGFNADHLSKAAASGLGELQPVRGGSIGPDTSMYSVRDVQFPPDKTFCFCFLSIFSY